MESINLIFEEDTLTRSKAGSITARISIQIGDFLFPGEGWSDFIVVILGWWLQATCQIRAKSDKCAYLQFMDGPYRIFIKTIDENHSSLICLEERHTEIDKYRSIVKTNDLRNELVRISRKVVSLCDKKGWDSDDIDVLIKEIEIATGSGPDN